MDETYTIELSKQDIDNLGQALHIVIRSVGLTDTNIIKFSLDIMDRCTAAMLGQEKKVVEVKKVEKK